MRNDNPCNICSHTKCDSCILNRSFNKSVECTVYDCMLNYEGSCNIDISEECGCRAEKMGERLPDEEVIHCCDTCDWHDNFIGTCFNGDSEHCADFTSSDSVCNEWEEKFTINGVNYIEFINEPRKTEHCCFECKKLITNECYRPHISGNEIFRKVSGCSDFENKNN